MFRKLGPRKQQPSQDHTSSPIKTLWPVNWMDFEGFHSPLKDTIEAVLCTRLPSYPGIHPETQTHGILCSITWAVLDQILEQNMQQRYLSPEYCACPWLYKHLHLQNNHIQYRFPFLFFLAVFHLVTVNKPGGKKLENYLLLFREPLDRF